MNVYSNLILIKFIHIFNYLLFILNGVGMYKSLFHTVDYLFRYGQLVFIGFHMYNLKKYLNIYLNLCILFICHEIIYAIMRTANCY